MNITLICGHYLPALGYLEVHLARALADLDHGVSVVTTSAVPRYVAHLQGPVRAGTEQDGKVKVIRLKPQYELGQVVAAGGVKHAVLSENPDLLIVIGLGKRFPKPVFGLGIPMITLFGDNLHSYAGNSFAGRLKTKLQFAFLKASAYKAAIDKSSALVAYTPESFEAAAGMLGGNYREKLLAQDRFISLGFEPEQFYFDPALRQKERDRLGLPSGRKVIITATRVVPEKRLEDALPLFRELPEGWTWLTVGHSETAYSREFSEKAVSALGEDRFRKVPHANRNALSALYNAADFALFTVPAISVFEALGTGLPCVLPEAKSLSHIREADGFSVFRGQQGDAAAARKILQTDISHAARTLRASRAADTFSWRAAALNLLEAVGQAQPDSRLQQSPHGKGPAQQAENP